MSSAELLPLFPSATHPAIPLAAQYLSTLRTLTAPGRGNDLRPEERTALVGVAALLGCERVQSKDLVEQSAQKASSVSPAHFRSALAHARRLLKASSDLPQERSPSRRPARGAPSQKASTAQPPTSTTPDHPSQDQGNGQGPSTALVTNQFSTPKKKFKYSSGVDISDLVRSTHKSASKLDAHSPAASSPLRHSVTRRGISTAKDKEEDDEEGDEEREAEGQGDGDVDMKTPTKRVKYTVRPGVDLESAPVPAAIASGSSRRRREDASAFFALRPGGPGIASTPTGSQGTHRIPVEDGLPDVWPRRTLRPRGERVVEKARPRVDWTFSETVWSSSAGREQLDKALQALPAWLEANGRAAEPTTHTLEEILLPTALEA